VAVAPVALLPLEQARSASGALAVGPDPVIAAAGDIACDPGNSNFNGGLGTSNTCRQKYVSDLLVNSGLSGVLLLGDNQYYCGGYQAFLQSYDLSWGRVKPMTRPAVGNHEYLTSGGTDCNSANAGAAGYYKYFGAAAGDPSKGYYSFDIGSWHLIALNSQCSTAGGCSESSPQGTWLRADLAAHTNFCTLAYWHIPLFSSGGRANSNSRSFWDALYAANADIVLVGHDHTYERFAAQTPDGTADPTRGIRQWVVGTGGANHTSFTSVAANSEVRNDGTFGVLRLTLHGTSYDWEFVPEAGGSFRDSGTGACRGDQTDTSPPSAPSNVTATATAPNKVQVSWSASQDNVGVAGYRIYRDSSEIASVTGTGYADTGVQPSRTYTYTVAAFDASGNVSPSSNAASVTTPADTERPTPPTNLAATAAASGSRVDLTWSASSDNVAVADYQVFRNGIPIGTSATTSYADTGVQPQTTYSYSVVARDGSGNASDPSNPAVVTTAAAPNTLTFTPAADASVRAKQPTKNFGASAEVAVGANPSQRMLLKFAVSGLAGRQVISAKLRLHCVNASAVGGAFHRVADSGWSESTVNWNNQPAADSATIASLGAVSVGTTYELEVRSLVSGDGTYTIGADSTSADAAAYSAKEGSVVPQLVVTVGTGGTADTTPPSAPTNLSATARSGAVDLTWTASTDNVGVVDYQVLRDGFPVGTATATSYTDTAVQPQTTYAYSVVARDAANNSSPPSNVATATTPGSSTLTFAPTADTYVQSDQPTTNFGASAQIVTDASPVRRLLLKFTVSGLNGRHVTSAKLLLHCVDASGIGGSFHRVPDSSWGEMSVNWNNQPSADAATLGSLGAVQSGQTYEVDVGSLVTGDGTYTIEADSASSDGAYYSSKEGTVPPQLVLSLG
jgi:chitodextrinase